MTKLLGMRCYLSEGKCENVQSSKRDFEKFLSNKFPSVSAAGFGLETRTCARLNHRRVCREATYSQTVLSFSLLPHSCTFLHKGKVAGRIMSLVLARACEHEALQKQLIELAVLHGDV